MLIFKRMLILLNQLKMGAILSYISIILSVIIALIYTPIMLRLLGQSEYGLYSLIGSLAAYFSILDLGLGNSIVRFISRNRAIGNKDSESKLIGNFIILYSLIGLLTCLVGIIVYFNINTIFGINLSSAEIYKAKIMLIILIINFALSFPLSVYTSIIKAYERFVVDKLISIFRILAIPIFTLPALLIGYGSISMVAISTTVNIMCLLYGMLYAYNKIGIKIKFGKINIKIIREISSYSFFIFLNIIVDQIFWKTDQVILGIVSGTISVAIFSIAMQFIMLYMQFSTAISNLFLPKMSIMAARNATNREFTDVMIKFGRIQYFLIAYIMSGFIIFGKYFINFWAGENYNQAYYIALIIMVPLTIPLIQNIGIAILQAMNRIAFRSVLYIVLAFIKIIISIPLGISFGGIGTAFATSLVLVFGHIIIMNLYYKIRIGIDILLFWKNIIFISIPVFVSVLISKLLINTFIPLNSLLNFSIGILLFSILYFVTNWIVSMNRSEKELVFSLFTKIFRVIKKIHT